MLPSWFGLVCFLLCLDAVKLKLYVALVGYFRTVEYRTTVRDVAPKNALGLQAVGRPWNGVAAGPIIAWQRPILRFIYADGNARNGAVITGAAHAVPTPVKEGQNDAGANNW